MARTSILVVVACLVFATGSASAALTAPQIVDNINKLTSTLQQIQTVASGINIINGFLISVNLGPFSQVIAGLDVVVQTGTAAQDVSV
jgi:hypothetical protein